MSSWRVGFMIAAVVLASAAPVSAQTFGGFPCADDCAGHSAGYDWAESNDAGSDEDCPLEFERYSFYEGCLAYVEDPTRGSELDDDGNLIGQSRHLEVNPWRLIQQVCASTSSTTSAYKTCLSHALQSYSDYYTAD